MLDQEYKNFLATYTETQEWLILKNIINNYIGDISRIDSMLLEELEKDFSSGERYAGRKYASAILKSMIKDFDKFKKKDIKQKQKEDNFN